MTTAYDAGTPRKMTARKERMPTNRGYSSQNHNSRYHRMHSVRICEVNDPRIGLTCASVLFMFRAALKANELKENPEPESRGIRFCAKVTVKYAPYLNESTTQDYILKLEKVGVLERVILDKYDREYDPSDPVRRYRFSDSYESENNIEHHFRVDDAVKYGSVTKALMLEGLRFGISGEMAAYTSHRYGMIWAKRNAGLLAQYYGYLGKPKTLNAHMKGLVKLGAVVCAKGIDGKKNASSWYTIPEAFGKNRVDFDRKKRHFQREKTAFSKAKNGQSSIIESSCLVELDTAAKRGLTPAGEDNETNTGDDKMLRGSNYASSITNGAVRTPKNETVLPEGSDTIDESMANLSRKEEVRVTSLESTYESAQVPNVTLVSKMWCQMFLRYFVGADAPAMKTMDDRMLSDYAYRFCRQGKYKERGGDPRDYSEFVEYIDKLFRNWYGVCFGALSFMSSKQEYPTVRVVVQQSDKLEMYMRKMDRDVAYEGMTPRDICEAEMLRTGKSAGYAKSKADRLFGQRIATREEAIATKMENIARMVSGGLILKPTEGERLVEARREVERELSDQENDTGEEREDWRSLLDGIDKMAKYALSRLEIMGDIDYDDWKGQGDE